RAQVRAQVGDQVPEIKDGMNNYGINSLWAAFTAYVSFFRDVCGWDGNTLQKFSIYEDLVSSCGWTWWHENVLAISDRPELIKRDAQGRLHSLVGHAIHYRDGWGFSCWHGVVIPDEWLSKPDTLTAEVALKCTNLEQRRAACELLGWAKILDVLNAKVIDEDPNPQVGTLLEVDLPDAGKERFLRVKCGTGRDFVLGVPKEMKTALEANLRTYRLSGGRDLLPEVRT
ncbi:MAG: DUF6745 domain-containing protein, partial [Dehalococcoidia bacterium]